MRRFVVVLGWASFVPRTGAAELRAPSGPRGYGCIGQRSQAAARSSSAAAAAAAAGSPPRSAWAFTIEREAVTSPAAGCGLEGRREVLHAPALGAHAGQQEDRARHQLAQAPEQPRLGGARDGADERQPAVARVRRAQLVGDPRQPLVQRRIALVLELGGARVGGAHQQEAAGAGGAAASISGSSASRPSSGLAVKASAPRPATGPNGPAVSPTSACA